MAHLFYGIRNLVGNGIPAPFGKPDVRRMRKSKTPKRIFFISLSRPNGDATKEKSALQLISKTFRCSRVAIASVPGKLRMKLPTVRVRTTGTVLVEMVDKNGFLEQNKIIGFVSPLPPRDSYIGFGFLQRINPFKSMKPLGTPRDLPYFFDFIDYSRAAGK